MIEALLGVLGAGWLGGNWLIRRGLAAPRVADGATPENAAAAAIKAHPGLLDPWLAGVTTLGDAPALPAVKAAVGL